MGVRVGRHAESQAQFYLKQQGEIEEVLRFLIHRMDRTPVSFDREANGPGGAHQAPIS